MLGAGRKKDDKRRGKARGGLSQYGLFDIPDINNFDDNAADDENDDDLEAELLALTSGNSPKKPKRGRPPPAAAAVNLDAMIAASMRDIPSDEELSGDDDDPDLLAELGTLNEDEDVPTVSEDNKPETPYFEPTSVKNSIVTLLEERLKMYDEAVKNANTAGETSRARRFTRGIKTLNEQLKAAQAGRVVNEEEIPPAVSVSAGKKPSDIAASTEQESADTPNAPSDPVQRLRPAPPPPVPARPNFGVSLPGLANTNAVSDVQPPPASDTDMKFTENSRQVGLSEQISQVPNVRNVLVSRKDQYKLAALQAKRNGDKESAIKYVRIIKQFDAVITAVDNGQAVDLSQMPPPPSELNTPNVSEGFNIVKENTEKQSSSDPEPSATSPEPSSAAPAEAIDMDDPSFYNAPPPPGSVMEALEQRLAKYRSSEQDAKNEGNSSKARRMGRIVKQYESAIKLHKAGKPIPIDELPTPPGFAPIPQGGSAAATPVKDATGSIVPSPKPTPPPVPAKPAAATPTSSGSNPSQDSSRRQSVRTSPQSRQEKQLIFLTERQKEFKNAALQAKRNGEINQAKEYLRLAKGFDPLIEASLNGLPVDMATLPVPPGSKVNLDTDFDMVNVDDCIPGSDSEIFDKLEEDLLRQAKMCLTTRDHFKAIGDVASANRFEQLAVHCKKDLDAVRVAHRRNDPVPKFHYENKSFSIVQSCTDLGDNELELTIIRGINYNVPNPKDVDTYVQYEFPYPSESPPKEYTATVKDTNNPEYNQSFRIAIHRTSRACQRIFKRHGIKLDVWSNRSVFRTMCCPSCCCGDSERESKTNRRGIFRADTLIGTATVKLLPLETKCIIHDSFDLMDGRKAVGGKLEVKVRIRNPILTKQVEQIEEKWLVVDGF